MIFCIFSLRAKFSPVLLTLCLVLSLPLVSAGESSAASIDQVSFAQKGSFISVSSSLLIDEQHIHDLRNGVKKEFVFYVDLFRKWELWPDEFISGIKFARTISSDPIKKEYIVISDDGMTRNERRFNSLDTLLDEGLKINVKDAFSTLGLQAGTYFIRITVESRIRKLAPIIGYLLFFVPEKEFTIKRDSASFEVHQ